MKEPKDEWFVEEKGLSFACTRCGNCCTGPPGYVWFTDEEGRAIAARLGVDHADFLRRFCKRVNGRWSITERWNPLVSGHDCVFLDRDENGKALCTINEVKPAQCRTWPFWPENLKTRKAWRRASEGCPGINTGDFYPVQQVRIIRDQTPWAGK